LFKAGQTKTSVSVQRANASSQLSSGIAVFSFQVGEEKRVSWDSGVETHFPPVSAVAVVSNYEAALGIIVDFGNSGSDSGSELDVQIERIDGLVQARAEEVMQQIALASAVCYCLGCGHALFSHGLRSGAT
jgi:hypothetical protein